MSQTDLFEYALILCVKCTIICVCIHKTLMMAAIRAVRKGPSKSCRPGLRATPEQEAVMRHALHALPSGSARAFVVSEDDQVVGYYRRTPSGEWPHWRPLSGSERAWDITSFLSRSSPDLPFLLDIRAMKGWKSLHHVKKDTECR